MCTHKEKISADKTKPSLNIFSPLVRWHHTQTFELTGVIRSRGETLGSITKKKRVDFVGGCSGAA